MHGPWLIVIITLECAILAHWVACTSALGAWLASSPAVYSPLNVSSRTLPLPEFTAAINTATHLPLVPHLGGDSFTSSRRTVRTTLCDDSAFPVPIWLPVRRADLAGTEGKGESQWPWPSWEPWLPSQCSVFTDPANATWPFTSKAGDCSLSQSRVKVLYCTLRREGWNWMGRVLRQWFLSLWSFGNCSSYAAHLCSSLLHHIPVVGRQSTGPGARVCDIGPLDSFFPNLLPQANLCFVLWCKDNSIYGTLCKHSLNFMGLLKISGCSDTGDGTNGGKAHSELLVWTSRI